MDKRFVQSHKEALWAVLLTLAYLIGWLLTAYLPNDTPGVTGLPRWFEMACLLLPIVFIILCWLMVKFIFKEVPLEDENAK
ncbi:YhdT family protein [Photorhabdus luminescens]|uniref:YhdT family protein n=1 Tax=Photorhabdus luminescens TaxID=29488 RepID=UPI00223F95A2|nr:YhdT family protein [Photorhabdus luminescens]MCW7761780.1 YhdT family protein [Photorhabdus luminescens subsp. venezuelensis]